MAGMEVMQERREGVERSRKTRASSSIHKKNVNSWVRRTNINPCSPIFRANQYSQTTATISSTIVSSHSISRL